MVPGVFALLACVALLSCVKPVEPKEILGEVGDRTVVIDARGGVLKGATVEVRGEKVLARAVLDVGGLRRVGVLKNVIELHNLPEGWKEIALISESGGWTKEISRADGLEGPARLDQRGFMLGAGIVVYSCFAVLVLLWTFSPMARKGSYPVLANIGHLVLFFLGARTWVGPIFWAYLAVALIALVLSAFTLETEHPRRWRVCLLACYVVLFSIFVTNPEHVSEVRWAGSQCIQIEPQRSLRSSVEVLDDKGRVLARSALDPTADRLVLFFWSGEDVPAAVRLGEEIVPLERDR
ncbi:MAG: hypothetical protein O7H41_05170 [Planctomycetota bacterium]|nr:hypothetical protein [Planctomycetota bacterium]